jgi:hypothetical protein
MAEEKQVRRRRPASPRAGNFQIAGFPKEFEKSFWEGFDPRFMMILGTFILLSIVFVVIQNMRDHSVSEEALAEVRKKALEKLYKVSIVEEEQVQEEETGEDDSGAEEDQAEEAPTEKEVRKQQDMGKQKEVRRASAQERASQRAAASRARAAARAKAEAAVASQGVLGLLTAAGGGGEGDAVVDILGDDAGGGADLGDVMSNVGGLAVAQSSGQRTRVAKGGGRSTSGGGIDELVEGIGTAQSSQLSRKGKIKIAGPASVRGRGSKSANRKPDVITKILMKHQSAIDYCYQKVAKLNPNLKGEISVRFAITPDGRTRSVKVTRNTMRNKDVERCIVKRIRGWADFPKINKKEGDVTVEQKYIFGT